jgi:dTDP-4-dehydrorhamnose reductase
VKILLTGRNGQIGWELERALPSLGEVVATDREALDLRDSGAIRSVMGSVKPDVVVNAAAYTAVDRAESESEVAMAINGRAPAILAEEARRTGATVVHYSTDYVFDGAKPTPYTEDDVPNPVNVYGATKLEGERAIIESGCRHVTLRTSWVYAARGKNFVLTMLRLARERKVLRIVDDQWGAPSWARDIALATVELLSRSDSARYGTHGLYHLAAEGYTSWHGFAQRIFASPQLLTLGIEPPELIAVPSAVYGSTTPRPLNSRLNCARIMRETGQRLPPWWLSVDRCLAELSRMPKD